MDNKNIRSAKRLKQSLEQSGITQQELANRSGVSKSSISQYMHATFGPSNVSASKMAEVLNVNPAWLMGFDVPMFDIKMLSESQLMRLYEFYFNLLKEGGKDDG